MNNGEIVGIALAFIAAQCVAAAIPVYLVRARLIPTLTFYICCLFLIMYAADSLVGSYTVTSDNMSGLNKAESISFTVFLILGSILPTIIIGRRFGFPFDLFAGLSALGISYIPK